MAAKNYSRIVARKKFHHLYRPLENQPVSVCYYCGVPAETQDHCPPLKWAFCFGSEYFERSGINLVLVPSCRECNGLLGESKLFTPNERMIKLKAKLEKRYQRFFRGVAWTFEEIDELGYNLGGYVRSHYDMQLLLERRLSWPFGQVWT